MKKITLGYEEKIAMLYFAGADLTPYGYLNDPEEDEDLQYCIEVYNGASKKIRVDQGGEKK